MFRILQEQFDQIRQHGESTYPLECCGVLLGPDRTPANDPDRLISMVVECANTKGQAARTRYKIDPKRLVEIQRGARENGLAILGFYHSHPDAPAYFSRTDMEEAYWTGSSYVIASIMKGAAAEVRSFLLVGIEEDKRFEEEAVEVVSC